MVFYPPSRKSFRQIPRRRGRIWLIILFLILVPVVGVYAWMKTQGEAFFGENDDDTPMTEVVTRGPFDHIVLEQGEIESSSNNEVKCAVKSRGSSGTPIISVLPEGTFVKKGDQICVLDSSSLEDELKAQRIVVSNSEALVISSDAALKQAEIARQEYLEGTYLTERKAILSEIALNQQALRTTELSLSSAERLAAKGTLKSLQIEAEQFSVLNARNNLDAAQGRLRVLDELTKPKMLVQFDSTIETAKAKLASDQSTLSSEKDQLKEVMELVKACDIRAPADGQVVHANRYSSRGGGAEFVVEAGAMVREQQTIILLPDPSKMQVKAKVNESRVTLLKEGMPVRIKVGAVTDELNGRVIKINKYAEPGGFFSSSVKEYATYIQIIDPPPTIRTGMTAEIRVFVEQIPDALQIPVHAVYETKGHHFALKAKPNNEWETVEVRIGATNEMFVTINSGLQEKDAVVLNPRAHLDKMKIPEIEEVTDREKLAALAKMPLEKGNADGPSGGSRTGGGNPAVAVDEIMTRVDTNGDGKISKEEAAVDERMSASFATNDKNSDGSVDKAELLASIAARAGKKGSGSSKGGGGGPRGERGDSGGPPRGEGGPQEGGGRPRSAEGT
jgi:HlyD family secretion protein